MSRAILMPDGSYKFVNKGIPPDPDLFPGFQVDPRDQYHLIPIYPPCKFRKFALTKLPCGKKVPVNICRLKNNIIISAPYCKLCKDVKRAIIEPIVPIDQFTVFPVEES